MTFSPLVALQKSSSPLPASTDSDHSPPFSHKASSSSSSSSSQWSSALAVNLVRPLSRELGPGSNKASAEDDAGANLRASHVRPTSSSPRPSQLVSSLPLQAQVARSELNVRLPRGTQRFDSIWSVCLIAWSLFFTRSHKLASLALYQKPHQSGILLSKSMHFYIATQRRPLRAFKTSKLLVGQPHCFEHIIRCRKLFRM